MNHIVVSEELKDNYRDFYAEGESEWRRNRR